MFQRVQTLITLRMLITWLPAEEGSNQGQACIKLFGWRSGWWCFLAQELAPALQAAAVVVALLETFWWQEEELHLFYLHLQLLALHPRLLQAIQMILQIIQIMVRKLGAVVGGVLEVVHHTEAAILISGLMAQTPGMWLSSSTIPGPGCSQPIATIRATVACADCVEL